MILYKSDSEENLFSRFLSIFYNLEALIVALVFASFIVVLLTVNVLNFYLNGPPEVIFSKSPGFYFEPVEVSLGTTKKDVTIHYSLDGSDPTFEHPIFTDELTLSQTTSVRARVFRGEEPLSNIFTNTYLINNTSTLPVFSITTDPPNLRDEEYGIFVSSNLLNRGSDWERPAHVEFFEPDGTLGFKMDLGIRIHGGATRRNSQKSLRLCSSEKYQGPYINYKIFPEKDIDKYRCIILRNSGNDWVSTMMRDGLLQTIASGLHVETQDYRPSIVYLNGEYMGIHNIREFYNDHYFKQKYGIKRESVVIIEPDRTKKGGYPKVKDGNPGDQDHYADLIEFVEKEPLRYDANYEYVKTLMDVDSFIDYNITEFFVGNDDWFTSNILLWRFKNNGYDQNAPPGLDGRWIWMLQDLDCGFDFDQKTPYAVNVLKEAMNPSTKIEDAERTKVPKYSGWPTILLRSLFENEDFKNNFINRYADLLNSTFLPERVIEKIDEFHDVIQSEIPDHSQKWGGMRSKSEKTAFKTAEEWETNVQKLRDFALNRAYFARTQVVGQFGLSGWGTVIVNFVNPGEGRVMINTLDVTESSEVIYFKDVTIPISATPNSGYKFVRWEGDLTGQPQDTSFILTEDNINISAVFEKDEWWWLKRFLNTE